MRASVTRGRPPPAVAAATCSNELVSRVVAGAPCVRDGRPTGSTSSRGPARRAPHATCRIRARPPAAGRPVTSAVARRTCPGGRDGRPRCRTRREEPAVRPSSATVASSAARENRVGGRNSRTRSQLRAVATSPRRAARAASEYAVARIVVQTAPLAAASARSSPLPERRARAARFGVRPDRCRARVRRPAVRSRSARLHPRSRGARGPPVRPRAPSGRCSRRSRGRPRLRGRGGEQEARRHDCRRRPHDHYWAILTLSRAAACVTCPAIAVARACAVRPSASACSGVKRRPAASCVRSFATYDHRLSSSRFVWAACCWSTDAIAGRFPRRSRAGRRGCRRCRRASTRR